MERYEFIEKLSSVQPELELVGEYKNLSTNVIVKNKYGKCKMTPSRLISGRIPNIRSSIDKTEYFKGQILEIHPELEIIGKYISASVKIKVKNKYGVCEILPSALLSHRKPNIESATNKTEYWINRAIEIHGDKYDYSKVIYIYATKPVIIICPIHGEFTQTPDNHLTNKGCVKCGDSIYYGRGGYNKESAEKSKEYWSGILATIYHIRCSMNGEVFDKIGVTRVGIKNRFSKNKKMPYDYRVIKCKETSLYEAVFAESDIIEMYEDLSYSPKVKFDGYSECFSRLPEDVL